MSPHSEPAALQAKHDRHKQALSRSDVHTINTNLRAAKIDKVVIAAGANTGLTQSSY
jgi:hypothetical protein